MINKKYCSKCSIEKDITDFHKCNNKKDGYYTHCKLCRKEKHNIFTSSGEGKAKQKKEFAKQKAEYDKVMGELERLTKRKEEIESEKTKYQN